MALNGMNGDTGGGDRTDSSTQPDSRPAASLRHDIWEYVDLLRRRWWLIAATCIVAVGTVWWNHREEIPSYTAEALLQQRSEEAVVSFGGAASGDFGSQAEIIRSRSVIGPVVDSLGLQLVLLEHQDAWSDIVATADIDPAPPPGAYTMSLEGGRATVRKVSNGKVLAAADSTGTVEGPGFRLTLADPSAAREPVPFVLRSHQATVESFQGRVQVELGKGSDLLRLIYTDADPRRAAAVVNAVARSYQEYRAGSARQAASRRRDVIATQLVELADSVEAVQGLLLDYQQREELMDPGAEGSALFSARLDTENEIRSLRFEEGLLESLIAGLRAAQQSGSTQGLDDLMTRAAELVPSGRALHNRLQELEAERSRLTASRFGFTDQEPRVQVADSLIATVRNQMRVAAEQSLELLRSRLSNAQDRLGQLRHEVGVLPERSAELAGFQQRVDAVQDVFDMLVEKYYEAQIAEDVEVGDVEVVDPAAVPLWPDPQNTGFYLFAALVAGLVIGGAGAITIDHLDARVRKSTDAQRASHLQLLGQIPHLSSTTNGSESSMLGKEALRGIRTNLRFADFDRIQTIAVTSAEPREGKTTTTANLALSFVEQGGRVLVIDADLRRPALHETLHTPLTPGLTDILSGRAELAQAVHRSPLPGELEIIPRGSHLPNAPELVATTRFRELIERLRKDYDYILIDTPPVLAVSDTAVIGRVVDGMIMVARANATPEDGLKEAVIRMRKMKIPLVGLILNAVKKDRHGYGRYSYYYQDADRQENARKGKRKRKRPTIGASS